MVISVIVERPKPIFMKKSEYVRKGSWDVTGLSDEEVVAEVLEATKQADEDLLSGNYRLAKDFFKEWDEERSRCAATK